MKYYIDSEIILQRRIGPIIYVYIMIITVVTLSLIIICILFRYKTYYRVKGIVIDENNHYYIRVYVPLDNVKYLINNKVVKIDKQNYTYKIISLDDEYFTDNVTTYQIVKIEIDLPSKYKFNNLTLDLKFQKENKRVIDYIIRK